MEAKETSCWKRRFEIEVRRYLILAGAYLTISGLLHFLALHG